MTTASILRFVESC